MFQRAKTAREVMRPVAVVLREDDDAWSAARRLFEGGHAGAPVLDTAGQLVGVVSQSDMASYLRESYRHAPDFYTEPDRDPLPARPAAVVRDLMSRVIVQVPSDMPADEVERHMLRRRVQRVFVVDGGEILGVIAATDLFGIR